MRVMKTSAVSICEASCLRIDNLSVIHGRWTCRACPGTKAPTTRLLTSRHNCANQQGACKTEQLSYSSCVHQASTKPRSMLTSGSLVLRWF